MYRLSIILLIISSIHSCFIYGQEKEELYVKRIDTENGLPSSVVYYMFEDSNGFIWIATDNGVVKYNGYDFEYYTSENGLTNNNVFFITEDPKTGYIWFNVFKGGICYYDGTQIIPHPLNKAIKLICKNSWTSTFYIDSLDNFWFTSTNREPNINSIDYNFYKIPPSNDTILAIAPSSMNSIEIAQNTYVKVFESDKAFAVLNAGSVVSKAFDTSVQVLHLPQLEEPFLQNGLGKVFQLKNGKILGSNAVELLVFDQQKVHHISHHWRDGIIQQVCQVGGEEIFICTSQGVKLLDKNYEVKQTFLKNYSISHVLCDKDGNYWFSTMNDGVFIASSLDLKLYFRDEVIIRMERGIDSSIYVSTATEDLYKFNYNPKLNSFDYAQISSKEERKKSFIVPISKTEKELFKSSYTDILKIRGDTLLHFFLGTPKHVKALEWANDHALMVAYSNGFSIYKDLTEPNIFNSIDIGFTEWVKVIIQDTKNQFWIGTIKGLYLLPSMKAKPIYMGTAENRLQGEIKDLAQMSNGEILVATAGNGVLVLDKDKRYHLSEKTGLSSNIITTIFVENDSSVWLGTNFGINHLRGDLKAPNIEYYNTKNGFPINDIRIIKKIKGHLFVGGNKGLTILKKVHPLSNRSYKTYLHHIEINHQFEAAQSSYTLNNNENNLVFHFRTIRFNKLQESYYRLIGIDAVWQKVESNIVRYNKLPHGEYVFEVRAKDSPILQVPFTIKPHFTQKWGFIGGMSSLFLSILIGIIVFFYRKQRQKLLQEQQMSDLENKALRNQMNPHFIFNAMNSIMFLMMNNNIKLARHYLYHFSKLMRLVLENSKYNFIPLQDEIKTLKSYLELEQLRYGEQIQVHWKLPNSMAFFSHEIPPMLIQPIIENALIHGLGSRKEIGNLWIEFLDKEEGLYVIVKDDGIGRVAAAKLSADSIMDNKVSSAIKNIKDRIQNINIIYQTSLGFCLEDLYEKGQASGTKATFFIPKESS
jgi:ligand-binding sensor domain-containing protein